MAHALQVSQSVPSKSKINGRAQPAAELNQGFDRQAPRAFSVRILAPAKNKLA